MGGLFSGIGSAIGGLFGGGNSPQQQNNLNNIGGGLSNESALANDLLGISNYETGVGSNVTGTALDQFTAGATGQLTPAQMALSNTELTSSDLNTAGTYANLGLAGSTMESQDVASNNLRNEAEQANLEAQSEQLGLEGLGTGLQYTQAGAGNIGGAANITQAQINAILAALGGGQSAGGGIPGLTNPLGGGTGIGGTGLGGTGIDSTTGLSTEADSAVSGLDATLGSFGSDADIAALLAA